MVRGKENANKLFGVEMKINDPEFTGDKLLNLVIDVEAAIGKHMAAATPFGIAVMELAEKVANDDPELKDKGK